MISLLFFFFFSYWYWKFQFKSLLLLAGTLPTELSPQPPILSFELYKLLTPTMNHPFLVHLLIQVIWAHLLTYESKYILPNECSSSKFLPCLKFIHTYIKHIILCSIFFEVLFAELKLGWGSAGREGMNNTANISTRLVKPSILQGNNLN